MVDELVKRIISKYDEAIKEHENINEDNKKFVEQANQNPDNPEVRERMRYALENHRQLDMLKLEREYLIKKYLKNS